MPINTPEELSNAVAEASRLLQEIQDYKGRELDKACKVRFPRRWIRNAAQQRTRVSFLKSRALRDNVAYTLILADVIHWVLCRTDLTGTAMEMLIKSHMFLLASIIESATKEQLKGRCGKNFCERNKFMANNGIVDSKLKTDLDWLWEMRNRMHLFMIGTSEYHMSDYTIQSHNRAVRTFQGILEALEKDAASSSRIAQV